MANWTYTINNGKALHVAINTENEQLVVKCLLACYKELYRKLTDEDKAWRGYDIEDTIEILTLYAFDPDDEDDIDYYLADFYDLCDELRAWITL